MQTLTPFSPPNNSNLADYRRVPLPVDFGRPEIAPGLCRPFLTELEAPLVLGAISQNHFAKASLKKVLGFQVYPSTVKAIRDPRLKTKPPKSTRRGTIDAFSDRSRRRLRFAAVNAFPALTSQMVLTYPAQFPTDGRISKNHLQKFLDCFRKHFRGVPYLWVLEFQRRGAPHYHLFTSLPVTDANRHWLASSWVRVACNGDPSAQKFHEHERNFIEWDMGNGQYVCKYLEKARQKDVPDGYLSVGRFWGASRGLVPQPLWLDAENMMASFVDQCDKPVTRTVRALAKYHKRSTSYWRRDDLGNPYIAKRSRVNSARSLYSFSVVNGRKFFVEFCKFYERSQRGRITFRQWSQQQTGGKNNVQTNVVPLPSLSSV